MHIIDLIYKKIHIVSFYKSNPWFIDESCSFIKQEIATPNKTLLEIRAWGKDTQNLVNKYDSWILTDAGKLTIASTLDKLMSFIIHQCTKLLFGIFWIFFLFISHPSFIVSDAKIILLFTIFLSVWGLFIRFSHNKDMFDLNLNQLSVPIHALHVCWFSLSLQHLPSSCCLTRVNLIIYYTYSTAYNFNMIYRIIIIIVE